MQSLLISSQERLEVLAVKLRKVTVVNLLALITAAYIVLGALFLMVVGENPATLFVGLAIAFPQFIELAMTVAPVWVLAVILIVFLWLCRMRGMGIAQVRDVLVAIVYCTVFTFMFGLVKSELPTVVPFWADPMFAEMDRVLHFGTNPRDFLEWLSVVSVQSLQSFYMSGWVFFATYLPVVVVAFDTNAQRARSFVVLWAACWVVLGNLLAVTFMSAGPIFADLLPNGSPSTHQGVMDMLARNEASSINAVRDMLWNAYTSDQSVLSSGISAFPSVHVGMATVIGLYILRLGRDLQTVLPAAPLRHFVRVTSCLASVMIVGVFMVLSVYLGWHYAVDGYSSIMVMTGLYWAMQRRVQRDSAFFGQAYAA